MENVAQTYHTAVYGVVVPLYNFQKYGKCRILLIFFEKSHSDGYCLGSLTISDNCHCIKINEIYQRFTDMVEPFSIDESWLDVTASQNLFGTGKEIADTIRETVKKELGLTLSIGVSYNKIFAKMGSDYNKPDGTTVISRENYKELLWTMDVHDMFFVGNATAEKLNKAGIRTIGDLAQSNKDFLTSLLGKHGGMLYDYANGYDESPVKLFSEREKIKSVGNGTTFSRDLVGLEDIKTAVTSLADTVASRLRKYQMKCYGVKVDIKDPNFKVISRQKQLSAPTNLEEEIFRTSIEIIRDSWNLKDPIRLLTITGINLCDEDESEQLSLFDMSGEINSADASDTGKIQNRENAEKMERTMDDIRAKFGGSAITFGRVLKNNIGLQDKKK